MGLRCSLLGHTFEERTTEEDREDRGSEVVTTVREVERCKHCGAERVVSENKEVTSVVDADDVGVDDAAGGPAGAVDRGEGPAAGTGTSGASSFNDDEFTPAGDIEEEDAEILTDDPDDRETGQWPGEDEEAWDPDAEPEQAAEPAAGEPEEPAADAGDAADAGGGGEIIDADEGIGSDDAGEAAADADGTAGEADVAGDAEDTGDAGDAGDAGEVIEADPDEPAGSSLTVPEGAFECPECGFSVEAGSSFRAGDACPDCQQGYLEERNR